MMIRNAVVLSLLLLAGGATLSAQQAKKADLSQGKALFAKQCQMCHAIDGKTNRLGPNLKGIAQKAKLQNGKPVNDSNLMAILKKGGNGMPGYDGILSSKELDAVLAYLKTL